MKLPRPKTFKGTATVVLVLAVAATLYGATHLSRVLFERPGRSGQRPGAQVASAPSGGPPAEASVVQVISAEGQVDAYRDGRWIAVQAGDLLSLQDVVRTVPQAKAVLRLGGSMNVTLPEKVEIRLDRLSAAGASVDLRRGSIVARIIEQGETLEITAQDSHTSNEGRPANFVVRKSEGLVDVAALSGEVRLRSGGKSVRVPQGTESRATAGKPPSEPDKIPEEVFLSVIWPEGERHGEKVAITGKARPSSGVTVNGVETEVGVDGAFTATVSLEEGPNVVDVETEDIRGRKRKTTQTLLRPSTKPPKLSPVKAKLWKR